MSELSDEQLERYARQIILKDVGGEGQKRLLKARVVVVGAGGIGCPALQYLVGAGVGQILIVDDDVVSLSNLQRQMLYDTKDVGLSKAERARCILSEKNPDCVVEVKNSRIDANNVDAILAGASLVIDGCDNFATRFIVSDASVRHSIPYISSAIEGFDCQIGVYRGWLQDAPCYRCAAAFSGSGPTCSDVGVLGAVTGIAGTIAALEALRALLDFGDGLAGRIMILDALSMRTRIFSVQKQADCVCRARQQSTTNPSQEFGNA